MPTRTFTISEGLSQIHTFGDGPENTRNHWDNLDFEPMSVFSHGHHARSGGGNDTFNFTNISNVSGVVVGRIEDFDMARDEIRIEGRLLDLNDLPNNVRIVAFNGGHNDAGSEEQPWLLIETPTGGQIFYTLEGARVDMNDDGGSNGHKHEHHFITEALLPDLDALPDIRYVDPQNVVPIGFAPDGGIVIHDIDRDHMDLHHAVEGTVDGDLIAAGLNDDIVRALGGNDVIWGGSGNDTVSGGMGNDTISGNTGHDRIEGDSGNDRLNGGTGNDTLSGGNDRDVLHGGGGKDLLYGGTQGDRLFGGNGDDTIYSGHGRDMVCGGAGDDVIRDVSGENFNADRLFGGAGNDEIHAGGGDDSVYGGGGSDLLFGGSGDDHMRGGFNHDSIAGQMGDDILDGGSGRDTLDGGSGNDVLIDNNQTGRFAADTLSGGGGDDELRIGGGDDIATGGQGADTFVFFGNRIEDDVITDYDVGVDELHLDDALWGGGLTEAQVINRFASVENGDVVFDFGGGNSITLDGVNSTAGLTSDIEIF
ncbi:calcium-binding protein [Marinovum sp. 2_MG-2023]|uniref:calcium-binding protein n=1 Tax=unclassified Marinovum TaxID=2647166 RepID=UPI0026E38F99|nr:MULTISPECIES: calcium-binding protein [unclassified Marinovum]MDO6732256.1 calcium-binding protein [Marinovum sp. 2_MG-2023]MDO6781524.1 calcium-binding protein [Marinovum sp. 1_MG-2023]